MSPGRPAEADQKPSVRFVARSDITADSRISRGDVARVRRFGAPPRSRGRPVSMGVQMSRQEAEALRERETYEVHQMRQIDNSRIFKGGLGLVCRAQGPCPGSGAGLRVAQGCLRSRVKPAPTGL